MSEEREVVFERPLIGKYFFYKKDRKQYGDWYCSFTIEETRHSDINIFHNGKKIINISRKDLENLSESIKEYLQKGD